MEVDYGDLTGNWSKAGVKEWPIGNTDVTILM